MNEGEYTDVPLYQVRELLMDRCKRGLHEACTGAIRSREGLVLARCTCEHHLDEAIAWEEQRRAG